MPLTQVSNLGAGFQAAHRPGRSTCWSLTWLPASLSSYWADLALVRLSFVASFGLTLGRLVGHVGRSHVNGPRERTWERPSEASLSSFPSAASDAQVSSATGLSCRPLEIASHARSGAYSPLSRKGPSPAQRPCVPGWPQGGSLGEALGEWKRL